MDTATLMRIALMPADDRAEAIDELVEALVSGGLSEADLGRLERQVRQVNAAIATALVVH